MGGLTYQIHVGVGLCNSAAHRAEQVAHTWAGTHLAAMTGDWISQLYNERLVRELAHSTLVYSGDRSAQQSA